MNQIFYKYAKGTVSCLGIDFLYFAKDTWWVLARQLVILFWGLSLYIAFSRFTSKEVFGSYQLFLSILGTLSIFSLPGLNTAFMRSVARGYHGDFLRVIQKSFLFSIIGSIILIFLSLHYILWKEDLTFGWVLILTSLLFPFLYSPNLWENFLQGERKFRTIFIFSSIQISIISAGTIAVLISTKNESLFLLALVYILSQIGTQIFFSWKTHQKIRNVLVDKHTFSYGSFLNKISFLGFIAENIDKLVVGFLLGPSALAIYSVVSIFAIKLKDFIKTFTGILFPFFSKGEEKFFLLTKKYTVGIIFFHGLLLIGSSLFFFIVPELNKLLFGSQYSEYGYLSQIFSVTIFFTFPISLMSVYINATKAKTSLVISQPLFFVYKILVNLSMIYFYGLLGAVIAFNIVIFSQFLLNILAIYLQEHTDFKIFSEEKIDDKVD